MQIKINLKIFIFVLFFIFTKQIEIYLELMGFALLHEIGHMLCGIILRLKPQKLEIMPVGFAVLFRVDTNNYNKRILKSNLLNLKKLCIAIAGPAVNLIFVAVLHNSKYIYINLLIFIFNMISIYPLDGGRILKYLLSFFLGKRKALITIAVISNITALILILLTIYLSIIFQNISYIFAVAYIICIVIKENKRYKIKINMYKILENNIAINQD